MQTLRAVELVRGDRKTRYYMEDEFFCVTFRRLLPADENRAVDLVQFWADPGGLRTIERNQIMGVTRTPTGK